MNHEESVFVSVFLSIPDSFSRFNNRTLLFTFSCIVIQFIKKRILVIYMRYNLYVSILIRISYFRVAISQVRTSSSIKSVTSFSFPSENFFFQQQARWLRINSRFADLRSPMVALIWFAISAQYRHSSAISFTVLSVPSAFLRLVSTCFEVVIVWKWLYHRVWLYLY